MADRSYRTLARLTIAAMMAGCCAATVSAEVTFDWVTVGNPGNGEDPLNAANIPGIGSVGYVYRIAKHEVTNEQYVEFLNAVAATDPNGLYNEFMGHELVVFGGINQDGTSGSFTYSVRPSMGDKPVLYVSLFDAMRFVNWLHNGQPIGVQDATTTESGVYVISDGLPPTRPANGKFFVPTENEWYKAAYHQPSAFDGDADDFWLYPTRSNQRPAMATANAVGDISNPGANVVNYDFGADWNGRAGNVTTVGSADPLSESFYGTLDQGGNAYEWVETVRAVPFGVLRGGSSIDPELALQSSVQVGLSATFEAATGFRVAIPPALPIDCDGDGDVDLQDLASFDECVTGPEGPVNPPAYPKECRCFDINDDGDIDLADWSTFQRGFNGGG